ncbi:hypothetical protein [Hyphomicrobium sp. DY-1]|uniref:hypothetical protein n=1 Tax=Hyphomicrobium sp. DY-1 TaxID=3075650 RepID=UPI0039C37993
MSNDEIPTDGSYRGVGLHIGQNEERLRVVRADIDAAHALHDLRDIYDFARDTGNAPEARLLARAKAEATLDDAVERRAPRDRNSTISREILRAVTAGLKSLTWQSRWRYCSVLDPRPKPGEPDRSVKREVPLPDRYAN